MSLGSTTTYVVCILTFKFPETSFIKAVQFMEKSWVHMGLLTVNVLSHLVKILLTNFFGWQQMVKASHLHIENERIFYEQLYKMSASKHQTWTFWEKCGGSGCSFPVCSLRLEPNSCMISTVKVIAISGSLNNKQIVDIWSGGASG